MEEFLGRKYKLKSSDNFEEYLKFIEVGLISRKTAISVSPIAILTKDDDGLYTFSFVTTFRTVKFSFRLDEEFEGERADGKKVKTVVRVEGNKLVQTEIEDNGRKSTYVREFTPNTLTVTTTAEGWDGKCVRVYEFVS